LCQLICINVFPVLVRVAFNIGKGKTFPPWESLI